MADGTVDVLVQGQLLDAVPDLSDLAGAALDGRTYETVDSTDGSTRFRVLADPAVDGAVITVIAVPTTEVDETVRNLAITVVVVALLDRRDPRPGRLVDRAARAAPHLGHDGDGAGDLARWTAASERRTSTNEPRPVSSPAPST